ncbi:MAG: glycerol kinase GlpK [Candidatus Bipolaricaulia bacterium]
MERYIAAIDQGTTGTRFMIFDRSGTPVASAYREHRQLYPRPGWVEHDPEEIWRWTLEVIEAALESGAIEPSQLEAIGIANQRETTVVWDAATGAPLHNAIVWQDRRTAERCRTLQRQGYEAVLRERTGLPIDPYFSATKLEWCLEQVPGLRGRVERGEARFGTIDSWLIWKLTGAHVTDYTNASRTMLFDVERLIWDEELLELFSIPRTMLPEVRPSVDAQIYGYTDEQVIGARIPVCGDLGDQQAALFGQAGFIAGEVKNTYGTGSFLLLNTGEEPVVSEHGLLTTIAYGYGRSGEGEGDAVRYALEGSIFITGAAVQWLRDGLGLIREAAETETLARAVESSDGVYFVPALVGLGAPHWDPFARGLLIGLTQGTRREHIVRATLEAIAYQTRDVVEAMEADSGLRLERLKVDGGVVKNNFLCQFQSDILNRPVIRPVVGETTALGAAYAAGLAVGYWKDLDELQRNWKVDRVFEPSMDETDRERFYVGWQRAVKRAKQWEI